jgi:uncharacterized integral membrane protein
MTYVQPEDQGSGTRLGAGAIGALAGAGVLVVFMLQNTDKVTLDFLFWSFRWQLWFLVLLSAVLGALVWFSLGVMRRHSRRKDRRDDRRD